MSTSIEGHDTEKGQLHAEVQGLKFDMGELLEEMLGILTTTADELWQ